MDGRLQEGVALLGADIEDGSVVGMARAATKQNDPLAYQCRADVASTLKKSMAKLREGIRYICTHQWQRPGKAPACIKVVQTGRDHTSTSH